MLSPAVAIHDLDGRHLAGWLELFLPPGMSAARYALVFLGPDRSVVHAVASGRGALDHVPFTGTAPRELAALRRALDTGLVAVLADGAAGRILGAIERALRLEDDYPAQLAAVLRTLKRASEADLWLDPPLLDLVPPLSSEALQRTFELLVPAPGALTAYVFDRRDVFASVIAVVDKGDISLVTTHLGIEDALSGPALRVSPRAGPHRPALRRAIDRPLRRTRRAPARPRRPRRSAGARARRRHHRHRPGARLTSSTCSGRWSSSWSFRPGP